VPADHGRVAEVRVVVDMALQRAGRGVRVALESQLSEHRGRDQGRGARKQPTAGKFSHA
jgi:hypothetical protein